MKSPLASAVLGLSTRLLLASAATESGHRMNLPVLYRVDQPTSNVVVFRGAQVALARQSGLLAPTSQSASGFRAKSRAASTYAPTSTSTARARHDEPQQRTYTFPFPRSEATGHRKVSNDEYQDRYYNAEAYYDWEYVVKDDYGNNDFGHKESRDGHNTKGQYYVLLPDGRLQTVTYTVDQYGGYNPIVEYTSTSKAEYRA